jgi:hypothetical protein
MQVNVNGLWTEWPEETPAMLPFDPTRTANPDGLGDNRGCPPGYFAQYVAGGGWLGQETVTRCRLFDATIGTDGGVTLEAESGPGLVDQVTLNVAAAASSVVHAVTPAWSTGVLILAAVVAGALWLTGRR